jgi:hypothetical protein
MASLLTRRSFFQRGAQLGAFATAGAHWLPSLAEQIAADQNRTRQCIVLWMTGGPSQLDTFDPKPDHANGGEFGVVETSVAGMRICEHLPKLAKLGDQLAIVRSLSTKEGDHERGAHLVRTGRLLGGPLHYPDFGAILSKQLGHESAEMPNYISIGSPVEIAPSAFSAGFLGPMYAPATVSVLGGLEATDSGQEDVPANENAESSFVELGLDYLRPSGGVSNASFRRRMKLWQSLQTGFLQRRSTGNAVAQNTAYERAIRLMRSEAASAFNLSAESEKVRESYGRGRFGQGCLLARRLIERGVPFVEVALGAFGGDDPGWDTHLNNFSSVERLCGQLDSGWSQLMIDLAERGMLENTTILWIGEFGRTPSINDNAGRDHFPAAWSCVFAGGGIQGGQVYGKTSDDGMEVVEAKTDASNVLATLCAALGVDPSDENHTALNRPIRLVEGEPIRDLLANSS